jgi:hypothetical protein
LPDSAAVWPGDGLDPDFSPSDLSSHVICWPIPPTVEDVAVATHIGDPITIALLGSDDGLPAPGTLTYRVSSLPTFGVLSDPIGGESVVGVPFDLQGDSVVYAPYRGYGGPDEFGYLADDGGDPPDGGESEPGSVHIDVTVGLPEPVHAFLVADTDPGFDTTGEWAFGVPTGGGSHAGDPTAGATGANVYGYNLVGDYANGLTPQFLTTSPLDLSNVTGTVLEFQRWLGVDIAILDHAAVQISANGAPWSDLWNHGGSAISESAWSLQTYDISTIADRKSAVRLRWVMGATNASATYPGWNIDDIRLVGVVVPTCSTAPRAVTDLEFTSGETLVWWAEPSVGAAPQVFDTLRSGVPDDFGGAATCVEADGADRMSTDAEEPAPGGVFHYLVRPESDCGPGPMGSDRTGRACLP